MTARATRDGVRTPSSEAPPPARFGGPCMQHESSWTMPSAFGSPPYPTLVSSGSSSQRFTPAMTASSTSVPFVIIWNATATPVDGPPFLKRLPFADATTTGRLAVCSAGACAKSSAAPAATAAAEAPEATNSRRVNRLVMSISIGNFEPRTANDEPNLNTNREPENQRTRKCERLYSLKVLLH